MKIIYKVGDLIAAEENAVLHQCNNRGIMGSGVAKAIRQKYPLAFALYYTESISARGLRMGTVIWADCRSDGDGAHLVGNIIAQDGFGRDGKVYTDYISLRAGFEEANRYLKENGILAVALPLIGAGLGNGKWETISVIIEETFVDVQPVVYVLNESLIPRNV